MNKYYQIIGTVLLTALFVIAAGIANFSNAQVPVESKWMNAGSLHNWFSSIGSEREHGLVHEQQYGRRWPAIYEYQDAQAFRGMWIGTQSFTDQHGETFRPKVVHVGPRVDGRQSFFPMKFDLQSQFDAPTVFVDGIPTFSEPADIDEVDETLTPDRTLQNKVHSAMGITMNRRIMQFSQEHHDNYHIVEYEYVNTGIVDDDGTEVEPQVLEDVWFFFINRISPVRNTRYVIGNASGWGFNTMIDRRGDGVMDVDEWEDYRAQFAWHGYWDGSDVDYNNIGAPIFEGGPLYTTEADSIGRLGAPHFVGHTVLHADTSPNDRTDDPNQPRTMRHVESDDPLMSGNDRFSVTQMAQEYEMMSRGHSARHAHVVEPSGDFIQQTEEPALGTTGGFSKADGYGPYTMEPGDTVRIVVAEAVAGLSREASEYIGNQYKRSDADDDFEIEYEVGGETHSMTKNEWVFTGRDSLFQTFERAHANFQSGYDIPRPPRPPNLFEVNSGGDGIFMEWEYTANDNIEGFEIYRAEGRSDSTYYRIHQAGPGERDFVDDDTNPIGGPTRGRDYYYYITALGSEADNDGSGMTPDGALRSSRYYTQTYDPARLQRPAGTTMDEIAIAPNPYSRSSASQLRLQDRGDRVAFYDVPAEARIRIYTEVGELVDDFVHDDGSGDAFWDLTTQHDQKISSGVYIIVFENLQTGEQTTRKFVAIL